MDLDELDFFFEDDGALQRQHGPENDLEPIQNTPGNNGNIAREHGGTMGQTLLFGNESDEHRAEEQYKSTSHPEERNHIWKRYCITSNNPTATIVERIKHLEYERHDIRFFAGQLERGDSGTLHLQLYVEFGSKKRLGAVKRIFGYRIHVEQARGTRTQNLAYCTKEQTRAEGGFSIQYPEGEWTDDSGKVELKHFVEEIKKRKISDVVQDDTEMACIYIRNNRGITDFKNMISEPKSRDIGVIFVSGDPGAGKTYWAHQFAQKHDLTMHTVDHPFGTNGAVWFNGYDGHNIVLFDEWNPTLVPMTTMNKFLDIYPLKVQTKGSFVNAEWTWVIITTNTPLREWYADNVDRQAFVRRLDNIYQVMVGNGREILGALLDKPLNYFKYRPKFV